MSPPRSAQKSMNWSASVLSSVSSDTEPTIVVTFSSGKYVFNVGENTHRAFLQSRRNWKRTRGLFLTSVGMQRAIGLPGQFCLHEVNIISFDLLFQHQAS
jgi:ribonuclease Z